LNAAPLPSGLVGSVGLIAALRGVRASEVGKLVLVRVPVGLLPDPRDRERRSFQWQVLALGVPVQVNGEARRDLVIPDDCLRPVSRVEPCQVDALVKTQALMDFDETAKDLSRCLEHLPPADQDFEDLLARAGEVALFTRTLQIVPVASALAEVGFTTLDNGQTWNWSACHAGEMLTVFGTMDLFGRWTLVSYLKTAETALWDERSLEALVPRGVVLSTLLGFWREAFGAKAQIPACLSEAAAVDQHHRDLSKLRLDAPPALRVDGAMLRAVRQVMCDQWGLGADDIGPLPDVPVSLSFDGSLLRIEAQGCRYGIQASGLWVDDCRMSLREFLAMPLQRLRGTHVKLEQHPAALSFNRYAVRRWA
jgi:hypothetical protein